MTDREYKRYSLRKFDKAAEKFDDNSPSVYNMCRKDYPIEKLCEYSWLIPERIEARKRFRLHCVCRKV